MYIEFTEHRYAATVHVLCSHAPCSLRPASLSHRPHGSYNSTACAGMPMAAMRVALHCNLSAMRSQFTLYCST